MGGGYEFEYIGSFSFSEDNYFDYNGKRYCQYANVYETAPNTYMYNYIVMLADTSDKTAPDFNTALNDSFIFGYVEYNVNTTAKVGRSTYLQPILLFRNSAENLVVSSPSTTTVEKILKFNFTKFSNGGLKSLFKVLPDGSDGSVEAWFPSSPILKFHLYGIKEQT